MPQSDPDRPENLRGINPALARWMGRIETGIETIKDGFKTWDGRWNSLSEWQRRIEDQLTGNCNEITAVKSQSEGNSHQIEQLSQKMDLLAPTRPLRFNENANEGMEKKVEEELEKTLGEKLKGMIGWKEAFFILLGVITPVIVWFATSILPQILQHLAGKP